MQFAMMVPQSLACVHHETADAREQGMERVKGMVESVLNTEDAFYHNQPAALPKTVKTRLNRLLKDLSWNALQLARECMGVCRACDYNCSDQELRLFTFMLFGRSANTKFFLEDVFNHVADMSRRHAKNHVMQRCSGHIKASFRERNT